MDQDQVKEFEAVLNTRKTELQSIIVSHEHILGEQLSPSESDEGPIDANHPADLVSGDRDHDKEINLIRRQRAELALVTGALARIEQGRFGICLECEEEIALARLQALPYTKYCINCMRAKDSEVNLRRSAGAPEIDPHHAAHLGL